MSEKKMPLSTAEDATDEKSVPPNTDADAGQEEVQAETDAAEEKGYFGISPDPTPRENYTVRGQGASAPTPETDKDAARAVTESAEAISAGEVPEGEKAPPAG